MPKAFTLIELLVSIALLVLITFGVAQLFPRAAGVGRRAEQLTMATNLAQAQIENMLGLEYAAAAVGAYEPRHTVYGPYARQTVVEFINPATLQTASTDSGLKRITVTVFYSTSFGARSTVLSTLIAKQ